MERTIQVLEDMLRACVVDLKGSWNEHFPLVEFAYNNSYQASIQIVPYEELYGRPCLSPIYWTKVGESSTTGPSSLGFDQRHLNEGGFDTETSSHGLEPVEELRGQATSTFRV